MENLTSSDKKKVIAAKYDEISEVYDNLYGEEQAYKHKVVINTGTIQGGRLLDCGCGTGTFLKQISSQVQMAVGVDISLKMLKTAKRIRKREMDLILADFDYLPFRDQVFDLISFFTSLPSPSLKTDRVKGWLRLAKPNGRIILSVLKRGIPKRDLKSRLQGSGFQVVELIEDDAMKDYIILFEKNNG